MERPQQPDKPTTVPTPHDPREKTPMQDPPLRPEHDDKTRIAGTPGEGGNDQESVRGFQADDDESSDLEANGARGAIQPGNASPDSTVFDENQSAR